MCTYLVYLVAAECFAAFIKSISHYHFATALCLQCNVHPSWNCLFMTTFPIKTVHLHSEFYVTNRSQSRVPVTFSTKLFQYLTIILKNSKVFEQKGDLLNFKANIDPMAVLSQAEPS